MVRMSSDVSAYFFLRVRKILMKWKSWFAVELKEEVGWFERERSVLETLRGGDE